jgi:hypothetical protein
MRSGVWDKLKIDPPDDEKLYPFTAAEIAEKRIAYNAELRPFLRWCCQRFAEWLSRPIAGRKWINQQHSADEYHKRDAATAHSQGDASAGRTFA